MCRTRRPRSFWETLVKVEILCGLPGSGKSTYARGYPNAVVCSADDYMVDSRGQYFFSPDRLAYCHQVCLRKFEVAIRRGAPAHIIVDNTNTTPWEIAPYYQLADAQGWNPVVVKFDTPIEVCLSRQTHGVPEYRMLQMSERLQALSLPPWVKMTTAVSNFV